MQTLEVQLEFELEVELHVDDGELQLSCHSAATQDRRQCCFVGAFMYLIVPRCGVILAAPTPN